MNSMGLLFCAAFGAFCYWLGWYNTNKQWNTWRQNEARRAAERRRLYNA